MSFWPLDITKACQSGQLGWSFHILLYILPFLGLQQYAYGHEARHPCRGAERNLQHVVALWDYAHLKVVGLLVKPSEVAMRCRTS